MVNHQKLSFFCLLSGLHHKAVVVMVAVRSETVFSRTRHLGPNAGVLRNIDDIAALAGHGLSGKLLDAMKVYDFFTGFRYVGVFLKCMLEALLADVVGAAFKKSHAAAHAQCF